MQLSYIKGISLALVTILATGCTSFNKKTIETQAIESLRDQTLTYTVRDKPDFAAMTPGKAMLGLIGAIAMVSEGNSIIAKNNVPDPAVSIADGLAKALDSAHSSRVVTPPVKVDSADLSTILSAANNKARFLIDTQTVDWQITYFPTSYSKYRVGYAAKARLIDSETRTVIAEGFCRRIPENKELASSYEELLANDALLLKKELAIAADECVNSMKAEMLLL